MKLTDRTKDILANFSSLNDNILIEEGNVLKTMNVTRNVFARAELTDNDFDHEVPIYSLSEFLKALGLFNDPELTFGDRAISIRDENSLGEYTYAEKATLCYPTKDLKFPEADVSFDLPHEKLTKALNAAKSLSLPNITLVAKDGKLLLRAHNAENKSSNKFDVVLGDSTEEFSLQFKIEHLKMLAIDYRVDASFKGIARFRNEEEKIEYMVGLTANK